MANLRMPSLPAVALSILLVTACASPPETSNRPPIAAFSLSPGLGTAPQDVLVDASSSLDPDGTISSYSWTFGDGGNATGKVASHTFTNPGTFTVQLTVTDSSGASASSSQTMFVVQPGAGQPSDPEVPAPVDPGPTVPADPSRQGTVFGNLSFSTTAAADAQSSQAGFAPGQVVVRYSGQPEASLLSGGLSILASDASGTLALLDRPELDAAGTLALAQSLAQQTGVAWAEPNYFGYLQALPNDPGFLMQEWNLRSINMPSAWDVTTGAGTVVGIVDSGILWTANPLGFRHPDLNGSRMVAGYDFISDPASSNDYDGRDPEPFDNGDNFPSSSFHGTLVAGIIAAETNNGIFMAGIDTTANLVNVRAFGANGKGNSVDILEGMMWAAGLPVQGVPANPHPARVINLSYGSQRACSQFEQESINRVLATGAIVVVAAGNHSTDASQSAPANCSGVIVVGASNILGGVADYSNRGAGVDLYAPGGDMNSNVISITYDEAVMGPTYKLDAGTSLAAAHVTGVISLLLGLNPELSAGQVHAILTGAAPAGVGVTPAQTGINILDAASAVTMVKSGNIPDPASPPSQPQGRLLVGAFQQGEGGWVLTGEQELTVPAAAYSFKALEGATHLEAWADSNGNGSVDAGDYYGWHESAVNVQAMSQNGPFDIVLRPLQSTASLNGTQPGPYLLQDRLATDNKEGQPD